jgi:hypothetical protein
MHDEGFLSTPHIGETEGIAYHPKIGMQHG